MPTDTSGSLDENGPPASTDSDDSPASTDSDGSTETAEFDHEVTAPRAATSREWELFLRGEPHEPLRHAGSVSAPNREVAFEQACKQVGWAAETLWLCPADEVTRRTTDAGALVER